MYVKVHLDAPDFYLHTINIVSSMQKLGCIYIC